MGRHRMPGRRLVTGAAAVVLAVLLVGCDPLATPGGDAPLRYRDDVFTAVTKTSNITYGSAVDQDGPERHAPSRHVPADRRHGRRPVRPSCGCTAAASAADRGLGRDRRRGQRLRPQGLRHRLDRLPAGIGRLPAPAPTSSAASPPSGTPARTPRRRCGSCARRRRPTASTPTRIAIGGSSAGRHHGPQRGLQPREPGPRRPPGVLVGGPGGPVDLRRPARQRTDQRRRRAGLLFHSTRTRSSPTPGRRPRSTRPPPPASGRAAHLGGRGPRALHPAPDADPRRDPQLLLLASRPGQRGPLSARPGTRPAARLRACGAACRAARCRRTAAPAPGRRAA